MQDEFLYMLGVVAVAAAVTYALRALPFLLFAGKSRALPPQVARFGAFVSPVIIAGLIVYSYSGLAWKTAWPYLAGLLTVALQLARGNPLASIVAGTALYMALLACCGCSSELTYEQGRVLDLKKPLVRMTREGIKFEDRLVLPQEVVPLLEAKGVSKEQDLHLLLDDDFNDQRILWVFMHNYLHRGGYRHVIPMHAQRTVSGTADKVSGKLGEGRVRYPNARRSF